MKREGNLFHKVVDIENIKLAHTKARRGKGWYQEVRRIEKDLDKHLQAIQESLINKTFTTSEYTIFKRNDKGKERDIYKLPYYPDRIVQWALLLVIEPYLIKRFTADTYSAIPGRGMHQCLKNLKKAISSDEAGGQYCLKIDVKQYYPNINHDILKQKYRKIFKGPDILWLLDDIIDSVPDDTGVPIGNYVSQYSGNLYLSDFDHWLKEVKGVKHYFRYMDDMVILGESKEELQTLLRDIQEYLHSELKVGLKENYQVFPTYQRGIDFVGYRVFKDYVLLRKSIAQDMKKRMKIIQAKVDAGKNLNYKDVASINSYKGWMIHANCYRLYEKYILPLEPHVKNYYLRQERSKS